MSTSYSAYSVEEDIEIFFKQTSATRAECDAKAKELAGSKLAPIAVQGACSYSIYAGADLEYVVQFRLESLALQSDAMSLASAISGSLVPTVYYRGTIGVGDRPLHIYSMGRVRGVTRLDFILAHGHPADFDDNVAWRRTLMGNVAQWVVSIAGVARHEDY